MTTLTDGIKPKPPIDFESDVISLSDYAELRLGLARIQVWLQQLVDQTLMGADHAVTANAVLDMLKAEYEDLPIQHSLVLRSLFFMAGQELMNNHGYDPEDLRFIEE